MRSESDVHEFRHALLEFFEGNDPGKTNNPYWGFECGALAALDWLCGDDSTYAEGLLQVVEYTRRCDENCKGLHVALANFDPPEGWVCIERCDICTKFEDDFSAARSVTLNTGAVNYYCTKCDDFAKACKYKTHTWRVIIRTEDAINAGLM
jgi:hypothetical protein